MRPAIDLVQQNRAEKKGSLEIVGGFSGRSWAECNDSTAWIAQGHLSRPFLMTKLWRTLRCHFTKYARITKSYHCSISLISALMFSCHIIDYDNRVLWGWAGWQTWSFSEVYQLVLFI
ncbi:hypothetical protein C8J56DRAFT_1025927 [Mycena floridula]|nr:hypothetical protein C8J56DRAFT_1025927 [Mycena floridula]